ncbi:Ff.00g063320.m01.CDS01 [Fusarium sp. VM40]|nr:Ff.00g063320.m01.CDS01 [Fusarium sp. VM40]
MSDSNSQVVVGCLLDVSGSMRKTLEPDCSSELASERLGDVLRAALKLAQAEKRQNPDALMFVNVFRLRTSEEAPNPPAVDLCRIAESLLGDVGNHDSGHDLLIACVNQNNVGHISRYIRSKLSRREARIINAYLRRHPEEVEEFVDAIPSEGTVNSLHRSAKIVGMIFGLVFGTVLTGGAAASAAAVTVSGAVGGAVSGAVGVAVGSAASQTIEDRSVENSRALALARRIQREWLLDFTEFEPQPVSEVIDILQRFQDYEDHQHRNLEDNNDNNQLDTLRQYMYGPTPMYHALSKALQAFRSMQNVEHRVLILISDDE